VVEGKKMKKRSTERGFTLVELIMTLVIIGILIVAAYAKIADLSRSVNTVACRCNQLTLERSQTLYYVDTLQQGNGHFAESLDELRPYLVENEVPSCPEDGSYEILPEGEITCTVIHHKW
jgi:prepilin-type N-terminal cleavage/methylation domain-containing protein